MCRKCGNFQIPAGVPSEPLKGAIGSWIIIPDAGAPDGRSKQQWVMVIH